ncbi:uncharacterized protein LOC119555817 [Drosophila subpulchrella]|uniref:uncharacterized protein LOC119555817 n=1 Tax=Drosophila subpulchrella TaxID=1486046 RepID=UPI0018A19A70|nr:uncharacterized protein LOC119555817 [Drosophila subpulchrella]
MCEKVTASCNWPQMAGNGLDQLVATRLSDEDVFIKPDLDDVINEERAVLFSMQSADQPPPCELRFQIQARYKIAALTLICSAPKVELFIGPLQEYCETIYGTCVDEEDPEVPVRPYRYDMEIDRSGINDINLKMLTSASEICVYGALLQVAPNPNGITTQLPRPVDPQIIQELLQRGGSSPAKKEEQAEKFQQFMSLMKGCSPKVEVKAQEAVPTTDVEILKGHIDMRFEKLTQLVAKRLDNFEAQQTEKLNKIIALLEKEK